MRKYAIIFLATALTLVVAAFLYIDIRSHDTFPVNHSTTSQRI